MNNPFVPEIPEKMIRVEISAKEADLIRRLRKYSYGSFVVYKANDLLIRVEVRDSQRLKEESGLDIAIK